jgi:hypothetical protein
MICVTKKELKIINGRFIIYNYMTNWNIRFYAYHINILKPVMSLKKYHEVGLPM